MKKSQSNTLFAVAGILMLAFCVVIVLVLVIVSRYEKDKNVYAELTQLAKMEEGDISNESDAVQTPSIVFELDALKTECPDAVGWLTIPDTNISYPVVQGSDNAYYLSHLATGESGSAGSLFLDANAVYDESDNAVIFGHHMKDGSMFADLTRFKAQAFYETHPVVYLWTVDGLQELDIVAAFTIDAPKRENEIYYQSDFASEKQKKQYIESIKRNNQLETPVEFDETSQFVTLSTCDGSRIDGRFIVVCKKRTSCEKVLFCIYS